MIVAMIALLMASDPGAVSRFDTGLVVASGLGPCSPCSWRRRCIY
nr:hypothetical protein [Nitrosococcus watsonii]